MNRNDAIVLLEETKVLLDDLLRCGSFYFSAIEINPYLTNPIDGEEFQKRIESLVERIDKLPLKEEDITPTKDNFTCCVKRDRCSYWTEDMYDAAYKCYTRDCPAYQRRNR